ncbi:MAG: nicotinate-nucleotide adenylyltransferase [Planctomycetes bacterium]|nr:nicotinate-nucleotide adenylyltransferase [Planctomycetota bacterium]
MKIGLLGGSFNPVHLGHLILAEQVRDALGLDRVLFIPVRHPPHKSGEALAPAEHRSAMVQVAVRLNPRFEMSDLELRREGTSYTIDTVRDIRRKMPNDTLFFIVGSDSVPELPAWKDMDQLVRLCRFAVGARPGASSSAFEALRGRLPDDTISSLRANFVPIPLIEISASEIRARVRTGRSIRHLVPEGVHDYIRTHGLYTPRSSPY